MVLPQRQQIRLFESSVERLGRCLSQAWTIKVIFKHNTCKTTRTTVCLPTIPADAPQELLEVMQGHLDHEAAHIIYTDFDVWDSVAREGKKLVIILNGVEDPRVERKMVELWRGSGVNLRNSCEWCLRKVSAEDKDTQKRPWDGVSRFSQFAYALSVYGQVQFDDSHWFLTDVVSSDIMDLVKRCEDPLRRAVAADHTRVAAECAREILKIIKEEDSPEDTKEVKAKGTLQLENVTPSDLEADEELIGRAEFLKEAASSALAGTDGYTIYTTEGDVYARIKDGDRAAYKSFMSEANSMVGVIKRRMSRALLSRNVSRWEGDKLRGKVNPRSVFRVALGTSKRVFRRRVESEDFNTVVEIMVDHSSSMNGKKITLAAQTAVVLCEVLHQLRIPFSITGFSTRDYFAASNRKRGLPEDTKTLFTRWGDLWIGIYKDYEEAWPSVNHRIINMPQNLRANTYDGESLRYGAYRLLMRPEQRKIMFWLNDGSPQPNGPESTIKHQQYARECSKVVDKHIELLAIGMATDNVKEYYRNHVVVNMLGDLPKVGLGKLDALLRKGKSLRAA